MRGMCFLCTSFCSFAPVVDVRSSTSLSISVGIGFLIFILPSLSALLSLSSSDRLLSEGDEQTEKIHEISRLFGTESNPEMDADVLAEFDALIAEEEGKKATTRTPAPIQKQVEGTTEDIEEGEEVITTEIPKVVKAEHQEAVPL